MRAGRIFVAVFVVAAVVVVGLAMTGKLPSAVRGLSTLASAWTASSSS